MNGKNGKKHYHNFIVTCLSECVIFYGSSCPCENTHTRSSIRIVHIPILPIWRKFCIEIIINVWHFNWIQFISLVLHRSYNTRCFVFGYIRFWRQRKFNKTCLAFMALIHTHTHTVFQTQIEFTSCFFFFCATIRFAILVADSFKLWYIWMKWKKKMNDSNWMNG